jgi:hypothetical protein
MSLLHAWQSEQTALPPWQHCCILLNFPSFLFQFVTQTPALYLNFGACANSDTTFNFGALSWAGSRPAQLLPSKSSFLLHFEHGKCTAEGNLMYLMNWLWRHPATCPRCLVSGDFRFQEGLEFDQIYWRQYKDDRALDPAYNAWEPVYSFQVKSSQMASISWLIVMTSDWYGSASANQLIKQAYRVVPNLRKCHWLRSVRKWRCKFGVFKEMEAPLTCLSCLL